MIADGQGIYEGRVSHRRVAGVRHAFRYRVFSVLLDCEKLPQTASRLRLFSHNGYNLFSLFDTDHGDGSEPMSYLFRLAGEADCADRVKRFLMLCYPRIFGYSFNPLTVYYGLDGRDRVCLVIYEVTNTFGERMSYVIPANPDPDGVVTQHCKKSLYVSPFNTDAGRYRFRMTSPDATLTIGVAQYQDDHPVLNATFHGYHAPLNDRNLLLALGRSGWMTVGAMIGIHFEAAKLWLKGLKFTTRPCSPVDSIRVFKNTDERR